jgi:hypothetical protein
MTKTSLGADTAAIAEESPTPEETETTDQPSETPAPDPDAPGPAPDGDSAGKDGAPAETPPPKQMGKFQKRIDELTRKVNDERRAKSAADDRVRLLETKLAKMNAIPAQPPRENEYQALEDYHAALAAYHAGRGAAQAINAERTADLTDARTASVRASQETFQTAREIFKAENPDIADYDAVVNSAAPLPAVANLVVSLDNSAQVAYRLAKDPNLLAYVNSLSQSDPVRAALEIGRLSAQTFPGHPIMSTPPAQPPGGPVGPPIKTKPAPPTPISPVGARKSPGESGLSDDLPTSEWMRRRRAQLRKR